MLDRILLESPRQLAPLHICAARNQLDLLEILLKNHADVRLLVQGSVDQWSISIQINIVDGQGQSALHHAALAEHANVCRLLLTNKIDSCLVSSHGQTAMNLAASSSIQESLTSTSLVNREWRNEIAILVREHEKVSVTTPTITDLELQLLEASKSGDLDVVKVSSSILSTHERDIHSFQRVLTLNVSLVNCRDAQGRNSTPLHFAAGYNRLQVVEYLLAMGADVTARDKGTLIRNGRT